jgi:2-polyprenyl-3-methyl-5-hydroxy-6-metoxy-1,4-benzoquinol methylase
MAFYRTDLDRIEKAMQRQGLTYETCRIAELGNQIYKADGLHISAKKMFGVAGILEHVSIDYNGKDGALVYDLTEELPEELHGKFDIVTNFGTIEHLNNQYQGYKNADALCKVGGTMIHNHPAFSSRNVGHCEFFATKKFFKNLAGMCKYEIVSLTETPDPSKKIVKADLVKTVDTFSLEPTNLIYELIVTKGRGFKQDKYGLGRER